jgi:beta-galactosidase
VHNWSWAEAAAVPPTAVQDLLGEPHFTAGEKITLGAWDVRLFRSVSAG